MSDDKNQRDWKGSIRNERSDAKDSSQPDNRPREYEGKHRNEREDRRDDSQKD